MTTIASAPPRIDSDLSLLTKWRENVYIILKRLLATRIRFSATFNPPDIANNASASQAFTVTGAAVGDIALAAMDQDLTGMTLYAYGSAANEVTVVFTNNSGGAKNVPSGTIYIDVYKRNL